MKKYESEPVGNAMKMREALLMILGTVDHLQTRFDMPKLASEEILELKQIAESALSAPPRNCDVGTADEQHARFYLFCDKVDVCKECPLWRGGGLTSKCCAHWGQMPYEGADAK